MTETPFFFANGSYSLFGVFHEPASTPAKPAFVFCHPFAEEKLWTHRVFVEFARLLAADAYPVLRFDYMGNGDSDGAFEESSLTTMLSDVRCAVAEARRRTGAETVHLLGLRLGATIAALSAETIPNVDRLILWAPIVDGGRYLQDLLRGNLTTQMATYKTLRHDREGLVDIMRQGGTVNVDGYEMGFPLYSEVSAIAPPTASREHRGPCLVLQIDKQPGRPAPDLQQLTERYGRGSQAFAQEEPFWKEIARSYQQPAADLFAVTTAWLKAS
jgi:exosortase A-associated hydrolase 2